jgi:adenylate cyclase
MAPSAVQLSAEPVASHWPRRPGPIHDWLIGEARRLPDEADLLRGLCTRLVEAGVPLRRASLNLRLLHPQLMAMGLYWWRGRDEIQVTRAERGIELTDTFLKSPMRVLFEGAGAVRQRLDLPGVELPFRLYHELRDEGLTDYVALPMTFSDGKIHGTTWSTDQPGGFESRHLALIEDLLPLCGLHLEIRLNRRIAATLLDTYVGHRAGERILSGQITRGSGETVRAAIWFCDLRGFTAMAERYTRDELLACLNQYYDCMAEAIDAEGGEILKFIGDAMLAVFPLDADDAAQRALRAAIRAKDAMLTFNQRRRETGEHSLDFGIGLHAGEVLYGNIGARNRLDFTVVGPAVNQASRIEGLSRRLGPNIIVSETFARLCPGDYRSLGRHQLDGVDRPVEVFAPPEPA